MDKTLNILIAGSLPPPTGGTTISLKYLVNYLKSKPFICISIINTSCGHNTNRYFRFAVYLKIIFDLIRQMKKVDILTVHVASSALSTFGLLALGVCRIKNKPIIIRKFGGTDYNNYTWIKRRLSKYVVKHSDCYLAQTKKLVLNAKVDGIKQVIWYPTSRPMPENIEKETFDRNCTKYVYIGIVKKSKGIDELIKASSRFRGKIIVDIYGKLSNEFTEDDFSVLANINYRGEVEANDVINTLKLYDALILPSYHYGEGYPGVILEAYSAGLPVISTYWQAIPEIVNNKTGLLVKPGDSEELYRAMEKLTINKSLFNRLKRGVVEERVMYSSKIWGDKFIDICRDCIRNSNYKTCI
jgi:glycosyltransferase involved in cell wall biosynthesis